MMNNMWGRLIQFQGVDNILVYDIAKQHMDLFNTLQLKYAPNVERFQLGFYLPDMFDPQDFIADAELFDEANNSIMHPISFFWTATRLASAYIAHLYKTSTIPSYSMFLQVIVSDMEEALEVTNNLISSGRLSDNVLLYFIETLAPSLENTIATLTNSDAQCRDSGYNVYRLVPKPLQIVAPFVNGKAND